LRPPNLKRWTYSDDLEGLLLFAQVVEESLFDYTVDSYRSPALNTFYRCVELLHALEQVRRASLHPHTLSPMVEELSASLENDGAAHALLTTHIEAIVHELLSSVEKPRELETLAVFLRSRLRTGYRKSLERRLTQLIVETKEKAEIVSLTHAWITQQINEGFAPGHLFYSVTQRFFSAESSPKIKDHSDLDAFFKTFETDPATWRAIFKVSRTFALLSEVAKEFKVTLSDTAPSPKTGTPAEKNFLSSLASDEILASMEEIKARDVVSARTRGEGVLRTLANLGYLHAHRMDFSWKPQALIYDSKAERVIHLDEPTSHVLKRPDCPENRVGDVAKRTWSIVRRPSFDAPSTIRLVQVLDLHAGALKAPTLANQLLNFWSAIETLLPPPSEPGRIVHIVRSASPLLCRAYPIKLVRYLDDNLRLCLGARGDKIIASIPQGRNRLERVAALVAIKANEPYRDQLYALCAPNPLLRFRLYSTFKKLSSAPAIRDTLEAHRRRVEWHVQRVYRSRNLILHAGESLPYLGTLIENVHSYLDRMLDLVHRVLETKPYLRTLDSALLEIELDHTAHQDLLTRAGKTECAPDTYLDLLFGPRAEAIPITDEDEE